MDHLKNALRLSPSAKKQKPDNDSPIFDVVSKIPNADSREILSKFFTGEVSKPTGCSANLWSLVSAFGDVLRELAVQCNKPSEQVTLSDQSQMDTAQAWTTISGKPRKRFRSSFSVNHEIEKDHVEALKEAERLRSVVVCHFPESEQSDTLKAEQDDDVAIRQMIHKLSNSAKVEKLYRLGKVKINKPRLIKVVLCTSSMQRTVLSNAKTLKQHDEYKGVYVRKSMTPSELEESNKKRAELRWLRNQDARWVIFRNCFWIRDEISSGVRKTVTPQIPSDCYKKPQIYTQQTNQLN